MAAKQGNIEVLEDSLGEPDVKVILLGDSAVGKSKLVERFMMNEYQPRQLSTFALTLFRKEVELDGATGKRTVKVDFWDTAGQERFSSMHPSYYYGATACILVFDVTRKVTYQNLANWYKELREYCETIPCFLVANKIDVDMNVTSKKFKFAETHNLEFSFVSAADGTNVVKVFKDAVEAAYNFKREGGDFMSDVLDLLGEESRWSVGSSSKGMFKLSPGKDASHQVVFDIHAVIHGCSNIPHPDAQVYCKWKLTSTTFVHSGTTETCGILNANRVVWDAPLTITNCILKLDPATKMLKSCSLRISIRQLAHSRGGYNRLGVVTVDLAEYLGGSKTTRSFLLEDSRLNSTLNITIQSEQVRGDVMFRRKLYNLASTEADGNEISNIPEHKPLRQKPSSPPRLVKQRSALQAVEDIVRELEATRANSPAPDHPTK